MIKLTTLNVVLIAAIVAILSMSRRKVDGKLKMGHLLVIFLIIAFMFFDNLKHRLMFVGETISPGNANLGFVIILAGIYLIWWKFRSRPKF